MSVSCQSVHNLGRNENHSALSLRQGQQVSPLTPIDMTIQCVCTLRGLTDDASFLLQCFTENINRLKS